MEVVEALPSIPQPPILPSQSSVVPSQSPLLPSQSTVVPPQLPSQSTVVATQTSPLVAENNVPRTTFTPATSQPVREREGEKEREDGKRGRNGFMSWRYLLLLQAVSVQYVPIPSQPPTIIIPTMQPAMPYMVPQASKLCGLCPRSTVSIQETKWKLLELIRITLQYPFCPSLSTDSGLWLLSGHTSTPSPTAPWQLCLPACELCPLSAAAAASHAHLYLV